MNYVNGIQINGVIKWQLQQSISTTNVAFLKGMQPALAMISLGSKGTLRLMSAVMALTLVNSRFLPVQLLSRSRNSLRKVVMSSRGGARDGAGRPKGEETTMVRVPNGCLEAVRSLIT
ncbi:hypothetical protein, partial [Aeromonas sp. 603696]|uniref:hypothetical protein n=1 Tax=Aeromonas sp. 603696 TaxID=2712049 RepID=UPI003BA13CDF